MVLVFLLQDHPSLFGWRAKDCEEGSEDSKDQRKASWKELKDGFATRVSISNVFEWGFDFDTMMIIRCELIDSCGRYWGFVMFDFMVLFSLC